MSRRAAARTTGTATTASTTETEKERQSAPRTKIFVLDTSVPIHDSGAHRSFQEHDVVIPSVVIKELDGFKKGKAEQNRQARDFSRDLDRLRKEARAEGGSLLNGVRLGPGMGILRVLSSANVPRSRHLKNVDACQVYGSHENDHHILNLALALKAANPKREVVLVTKDVNLRIKADGLDLIAEDYETTKVESAETLYTGIMQIDVPDSELITRLHRENSVPVELVFANQSPTPNQYVLIRNCKSSGLAHFSSGSKTLERVQKLRGYGVDPRNLGQTFAMHALLDDRVKLVTIQGKAGTGKTLLALSAALAQRSAFRRIYLARPIVPLSNKEIGFLPGDAGAKVGPYMASLFDNLDMIRELTMDRMVAEQEPETDARKAKRKTKGTTNGSNGHKVHELDKMTEEGKLHVVPLAFIRGRTFYRILLIVDEAQNLTPHEIKTIVTRAGEGTKIVFTGDVHQIDTPYLDAESNGLSYLIDRMRGQDTYAHVTLEKGERSPLAELAAGLL